MFVFNYSINVDPALMKAIEVVCEIEYVDPGFEKRVLNILERNNLYMYISEETGFLSRIFKEQVYLSMFLKNGYNAYNRDITQDFINKRIILPLKYHENVEKAKLLFEKKINRVFRKEIQYYKQVQQINIS